MRRLAAAVTSALVALACGVGVQGSPAAAAGRRAFLLGDSVMAGLNFSSAARAELDASYDVALDAKVCRALREPSCSTKYDGRPPSALSVMQAEAGNLGDALVMMVGYNDSGISSGVDAIMAEAAARGVPHVLWLTYRNPSGRYSDSNATLWAKTAEYPTLTVVDWDAFSAGHGNWFGGDGLHLTGDGRMALAGFLVANLDTLFAGGSGGGPSSPRCAGPVADTPTPAPADGPVTDGQAGGFTPTGPLRVIDTRAAAPLGAGQSVDVDLSPTVPAGRVKAGGTCRPRRRGWSTPVMRTALAPPSSARAPPARCYRSR